MSTQPSDSEHSVNVRRESYWIPSVAIIGCLVTGIASFVGGIVAMGDASSQNPLPYVGAGACWIASGLTFGLLANAIYRR